MKVMITILALIAAVSVSGVDVMRKVEERYDGVETMTMGFSQVITYASTDQKSAFQGRILLAKPDRMRMSVFEPDTQLLVSSGGSLWIYIKEANQALFYDLSEESYPQIGTLIFNVSKEFSSRLIGKTQDKFMVKLLPKEKSRYYDSLYAKVSSRSYLIHDLSVFDKQANRIDYAFQNIRTNVEIENKNFVFVPPPGAEVIKRQ